jgi:hypothetical protein
VPGLEAIERDWARARDRGDLLRALQRAGFLDPQVASEAQLRQDERLGRASVYFARADSSEVWGVSLDEPAVAVGMPGPGHLVGDPMAMSNLCSGLMRLLMRPCGEDLVTLAGVATGEALRVGLVDPAAGATGTPVAPACLSAPSASRSCGLGQTHDADALDALGPLSEVCLRRVRLPCPRRDSP